MGTIILPCKKCGSTRDRKGRCDCPVQTDAKTGLVIKMEQCQFCGGHYAPGTWSQHRCRAKFLPAPSTEGE